MASTPLFSVVIAAYNCESTVAAAVRSALRQTEPGREVIVVDDGSTDGTAAAVEAIGDDGVRLIKQPNRGSAGARNAGIAAARGSFVAFLDGDDLWLPRYLEAGRRAVTAPPGADMAYTDAYAFDGATGRVRRQTAMHWWQPSSAPVDRDSFLLELLRDNFIYNSVIISRKLLEDVGGYDESVQTHEDYDLWLRIALRGNVPVRISEPQALYRMHPGQKSRNALNVAHAVVAILDRIPADQLPTDDHRRVLAGRKREVDQTLRILTGKAPVRRAARLPRHLVSRVWLASGLRESWYPTPPAEIAAAFPDLTSV
jgi:glycosyltransferase involved in cell wall biosynthesis